MVGNFKGFGLAGLVSAGRVSKNGLRGTKIVEGGSSPMQCGRSPAITTHTTASLTTSHYYSLKRQRSRVWNWSGLCVSASVYLSVNQCSHGWTIWATDLIFEMSVRSYYAYYGAKILTRRARRGGNFITVPMECRFASSTNIWHW